MNQQIKRYAFTEILISGIVCYHKAPASHGEYVLFSDYQAAMSELESQVRIMNAKMLTEHSTSLRLKDAELYISNMEARKDRLQAKLDKAIFFLKLHPRYNDDMTERALFVDVQQFLLELKEGK
jgi:hypothetical protein